MSISQINIDQIVEDIGHTIDYKLIEPMLINCQNEGDQKFMLGLLEAIFKKQIKKVKSDHNGFMAEG